MKLTRLPSRSLRSFQRCGITRRNTPSSRHPRTPSRRSPTVQPRISKSGRFQKSTFPRHQRNSSRSFHLPLRFFIPSSSLSQESDDLFSPHQSSSNPSPLSSPSFVPHSHLALQSSHEFSPTSAILGGMLAQDLLKAMAKKDPPLLNFCAFDGMRGVAWVAKFGVGKAEEVSVVVETSV